MMCIPWLLWSCSHVHRLGSLVLKRCRKPFTRAHPTCEPRLCRSTDTKASQGHGDGRERCKPENHCGEVKCIMKAVNPIGLRGARNERRCDEMRKLINKCMHIRDTSRAGTGPFALSHDMGHVPGKALIRSRLA